LKSPVIFLSIQNKIQNEEENEKWKMKIEKRKKKKEYNLMTLGQGDELSQVTSWALHKSFSTFQIKFPVDSNELYQFFKIVCSFGHNGAISILKYLTYLYLSSKRKKKKRKERERRKKETAINASLTFTMINTIQSCWTLSSI